MPLEVYCLALQWIAFITSSSLSNMDYMPINKITLSTSLAAAILKGATGVRRVSQSLTGESERLWVLVVGARVAERRAKMASLERVRHLGREIKMVATTFSRVSFHSSCVHHKTKLHNLKGKPTSSQEWLKRQLNDPYVKMAKTENYRCRSAFKLIEIDDKYHLLQPGLAVIDCGASPGSWTQVAVERVCYDASKNGYNGKGLVIGIDLQHMLPVEGAYILHQSDFTSKETQQIILTILNGRQADIVMSDMAPSASGQKSLDHDIIVDLCYSVLLFSRHVLKPGGHVLCKLWQCGEQHKLELTMRKLFENVKVVKPSASRKDSSEIFLLGRNFVGKAER